MSRRNKITSSRSTPAQENASFRKRLLRGLGGGSLHSSLIEMPSGQVIRYLGREVDLRSHKITILGYEPVDEISPSEEANMRVLPPDFPLDGEDFSVGYRVVEKPEYDYEAAQRRQSGIFADAGALNPFFDLYF